MRHLVLGDVSMRWEKWLCDAYRRSLASVVAFLISIAVVLASEDRYAASRSYTGWLNQSAILIYCGLGKSSANCTSIEHVPFVNCMGMRFPEALCSM